MESFHGEKLTIPCLYVSVDGLCSLDFVLSKLTCIISYADTLHMGRGVE